MSTRTRMEIVRRIVSFAEDERHRQSHPAIDLDHIFLALLSVGGPVTTALRGRGVTLEGARAAVDGVRVDRAAGLGVSMDVPASRGRPGPFDAPQQVDFTDRAREALTASYSTTTWPDVALWDAVLAEPTQLVHDALARLGVEPSTLEIPERDPEPSSPRSGGRWSVSRSVIPADIDAVWGLVSDPERWMEWNSSELASAQVSEDGSTISTVMTAPPKRRVDPARLVSEYRVTETSEGQSIQWLRTADAVGTRWHQRIDLAPVAGGTEVTMSYRAELPPTWKTRLIGGPFQAYIRWATRFMLERKLQDLTRALAQ